jgi:dolichol-phosphate mannosyltransferase
LGFVVASSIGGAVQFGVASAILAAIPGFVPQLAALVGVAAGFIFNFVANRFVVFKKRHPVRGEHDRAVR